MKKENISLLISGGLDSVVLAHHAVKNLGQRPLLIHLDQGQPASREERENSIKTAKDLNLRIEILDANGLWSSFTKVANNHTHICMGSNPSPFAGMIYGAQFSAWSGIKEMAIGIHADDVEVMPWIPKLIAHYESALGLIRPPTDDPAIGGDEFVGFKFSTPFLKIRKSEIVRHSQLLGVDVARARSCQLPGISCGKCRVCNMRLKAFRDAGTVDTVKYA